MPNSHIEEDLAHCRREVLALHAELQAAKVENTRNMAEARISNAKLIHALDCAIQWAEALFVYLPEGTVMPEGVKIAKERLSNALAEIRK